MESRWTLEEIEEALKKAFGNEMGLCFYVPECFQDRWEELKKELEKLDE